MVESVAWITERKNVLSLVFYLGAVLAYGRFNAFWNEEKDSATRVPKQRDWMAYGLAFVLFLAALLAKTTAFSLPAVILLICWWKRGRMRWRGDILPTVPFFGVAIGQCVVTAWLERNHVGAKGAEWVISFPERCLIAGRAVWFYAGKLFWPAKLCFVYPRWELNSNSLWQWLYPVSAVAALLALWLARGRLGRGPVAAALYFVGTLFPVLGFMNVYFMYYSFVCDHWVYLSSLGLIALGAALVARGVEHFRTKAVLYGLGAVVLPVLGMLTWRQCGMYADIETLWRDTLRKNPGAWLAHNNLGVVLWNQGNISEAIEHYEKALQFDPAYAQAHNNLGIALKQMGKIEEAIGQYQQALQLNPDFPEAHYNFGVALEDLDRTNDAIGQYDQALQLKSNFFEPHYNLGLILMRLGRIPEAVEHYNEAVRIQPDSAKAHDNLALALVQQGKFEDAITHWQQALRIQPDYPEAGL